MEVVSDFKIHLSCGDGVYCGAFSECSDCGSTECPVGLIHSVCAVFETDDMIFYGSFYQYADLDYTVCVPDF